jgi:hypothetical protein
MIDVVALVAASDPRPDDNNVVAGWVGFVVFLGLIVAVILILRSFTKQIKKVREADAAGVFDDPSDDSSDTGSPHHQA